MSDLSIPEFTGYDAVAFAESDRAFASANATAFCYAMGEERHHKVLDPRPYLKVENQFQMGSCVGNGFTTGGELIAGLQVGDISKIPQFSRWASYYWGRQIFGNLGVDGGCSIQAGAKAAQTVGFCLEALVPYPSVFNTFPLPPEAKVDAAKRRVQSIVVPRSASDILHFIDGGYGAYVFGVLMSARMKQGDFTLSGVRADGGRGGHCMVVVGFLENGDLIVANSWGTKWGLGGYAIMTLDACNYLLQQPYSAFVGISDLTGFDKVRVLASHRGAG